MTRYGMVIDITKCTGCYNCFLTCRDEFAGNDYPGYAAAQPMSGHELDAGDRKGKRPIPQGQGSLYSGNLYALRECRLHQSWPRTERSTADQDGIVIIDPVKAKGQKQIVNACPYRVIEWNEEKQVAAEVYPVCPYAG